MFLEIKHLQIQPNKGIFNKDSIRGLYKPSIIMNNLKAKHILVWMLFSMLMPSILVVSIMVFADLSHNGRDYLDLAILLIVSPASYTIPLSLMNLLLFKRILSPVAAKRIATIPLGLSVVYSGILFLLACWAFLSPGDSDARINFTLGATGIYSFLAIIAIRRFRNKIEELVSW